MSDDKDADGMYLMPYGDQVHVKYRTELYRQMNEAYMRLDYRTADRIAKLLGVKSPVVHEMEDRGVPH